MDKPQMQDAGQRLKVHYFYIRGKCQPIRNLLYYLQVDFEDIMHEKSQEVEVQVGFNMGLPMVEDRELRVHDAVAIMIYISRKYENVSLIGQTPQNMARVQEILMKYSAQRNKIFGTIFESLRIIAKNEREAYEAVFRKLLNQCRFVDFCLKSVMKSKKFIMDYLTLADFVFYQICFYLCGFYQDFISTHPYYKYILQFKKTFEKLDFFSKNKAKIENVYLFLEFNNQKMNNDIQNSWKGAKLNLIKRQNIHI